MSVVLHAGDRGQFDVLVDGRIVATKDAVGFLARLLGDRGFPDEKRSVEAVRAALGA